VIFDPNSLIREIPIPDFLISEFLIPENIRAQPIGLSTAPRMAGQARGEGERMAGRHANRRDWRLFRGICPRPGVRPVHNAVTPGRTWNQRRANTLLMARGRAPRAWERCRRFGANPMFGILSARIAGVVGILSLALVAAGLVSVPSFPMTGAAGAALPRTERAVSVNRAHKGDRLPIPGSTVRQFDAPVSPPRPQSQIPPGCDPTFSPISSPLLANVFRRCIA
jgi:hypothetical protein